MKYQEPTPDMKTGEIENRFFVSDGKILSTLFDLTEALVMMTAETYYYHANDQKNDFANWVEHLTGDMALTQRLRESKDKDEAFMVLMEHVDVQKPKKRKEKVQKLHKVKKAAMEWRRPDQEEPDLDESMDEAIKHNDEDEKTIHERTQELKQELGQPPAPAEPEPVKEGLISRISKHIRHKQTPEEMAATIEEEQSEDDSETEEEPPRGQTNQIARLQADIEQLKAQTTAVKEARKVTNERFMRIAEELGSIRNNSLGLEKQMKDIMLRVVKSVNLVEAVHPEKLFEASQKQNTRIEALGAKIEGNQTRSEHIMEELKEIRGKMGLFRGVEEILKLNDEVKQKLLMIQKIKVMTERHADKIENMFVDVKKKFDRFERLEELGKEMKETADAHAGDVEKVTAQLSSFTTKDDLEAIKKENAESAELVLTEVNEVKGALAELQEKGGDDALQNVQRKIHETDTQTEALRKTIEDLKQQLETQKHAHDVLAAELKKKKRATSSHGIEQVKKILVNEMIDMYKHIQKSMKEHDRKFDVKLKELKNQLPRAPEPKVEDPFNKLKDMHKGTHSKPTSFEKGLTKLKDLMNNG